MAEAKVEQLPKEWTTIASLFRAAVTGRDEEITIPENLVWEDVYKQCKRQMIGAAVSCVLSKVDCPDEIRKKFRQLNLQSLRRYLLFEAERENIYRDLDARGIVHMSLKGILCAPLFPSPEMREMTDNDILIHPEDAKEIKSYMTERGYEYKDGSVHSSCYKAPVFSFEFHKKLFHDKKMQADFDDVWQRANQVADGRCEYRMSPEDVYLHTVAHFHKHYSDRGWGIRAFADLYLLRKHGANYDWDYINSKLNDLGLQDFAAFFVETSAQLFDGDVSKIPDETVRYILGSGACGTVAIRASNGIKNDGYTKYFWRRVFIPYSMMCGRYPCLFKLPFLLPVFWVVRLADAVLNKERRKSMREELTEISNYNEVSKK